MLPKINFSKVESLSVIATDDGFIAQLTYKSGQRRGYTFEPIEPLDLFIADAERAGVKVIPLPAEPQLPDGAIWCELCGERPTLPGVPCEVCQKLGATEEHITALADHPYGDCIELIGEPCDSCLAYHDQYGDSLLSENQPTDVTSPKALVEILALTPEQAAHLTGASRLNFWNKGTLHIQIEHGSRAVKFPLPNAVVTEHDLSQFFAGWGWKQLDSKPYFKPEHDSLVRL